MKLNDGKVYILMHATPHGDSVLGVYNSYEVADTYKFEWNSTRAYRDHAFISEQEVHSD